MSESQTKAGNQKKMSESQTKAGNQRKFENLKKNFEPRHENKSCSACPEDQLKPF